MLQQSIVIFKKAKNSTQLFVGGFKQRAKMTETPSIIIHVFGLQPMRLEPIKSVICNLLNIKQLLNIIASAAEETSFIVSDIMTI